MAGKYQPVEGTTYKVGFQRMPETKHCWKCLAKTDVEMVGRGDTTGGGVVKVPICQDCGHEVIHQMGLAEMPFIRGEKVFNLGVALRPKDSTGGER